MKKLIFLAIVGITLAACQPAPVQKTSTTATTDSPAHPDAQSDKKCGCSGNHEDGQYKNMTMIIVDPEPLYVQGKYSHIDRQWLLRDTKDTTLYCVWSSWKDSREIPDSVWYNRYAGDSLWFEYLRDDRVFHIYPRENPFVTSDGKPLTTVEFVPKDGKIVSVQRVVDKDQLRADILAVIAAGDTNFIRQFLKQ
jgi:hypothetical protein